MGGQSIRHHPAPTTKRAVRPPDQIKRGALPTMALFSRSNHNTTTTTTTTSPTHETKDDPLSNYQKPGRVGVLANLGSEGGRYKHVTIVVLVDLLSFGNRYSI